MAGDHGHFLLVEGNTVRCDGIRQAFASQAKVALTIVHTLTEARLRLRDTVFDLVLVAWRLPDGSGLELLPAPGDVARFPVLVLAEHDNKQLAVQMRPAGVMDWLDTSTVPLDHVPRLAAVALASWWEIAEHRQSEGGQQRAERRFHEFFEHASDVMFTVDSHGKFSSINRAAEQLSGYTREAILQMHVDDLLASGSEQLHRQLHEVKRRGQEWARFEVDIVTRQQQKIALEIGFRLIYRHGIPVEVQGIARDVSHRVREEKIRRQIEAQLRQTTKMEAIGTLAGGIAHEFNNILASMLGYTELALREVAPHGNVSRQLQEVLVAGQRAKALVQQIVAFSQQSEQVHRPMALQPLVREVGGLLSAALPSTITLQYHVAPQGGVVRADLAQLQLVLMQLCANAEYSMRGMTGGILDIRLERITVGGAEGIRHAQLLDGPYVCLTVRDTGQGMAPEVLERAFEPFYTTREVGEGSGMGLAVVLGIVRRHGGDIILDSTVGQGTTCRVYLPEVTIDMPPHEYTALTFLRGSERLLLVEDEVPLAYMGREALTRLGYTVEMHTDSQAALAAFQATPQRFDVLITDQTMPGMTGEQLAQEVRRIRPEMPIILCTGFSHAIDVAKARALGINAFLMKPVTIQELAEVVRRALDER